MKRKLFSLAAALTALLSAAALTSCDMVYVANKPDSGGSGNGSEITAKEKDELERNGHFLKLLNMPLNIQPSNVFSVSVANSSSSIGKLNKDSNVFIFKEADSCTVYLPLVYNDDNDFLETGFFYTAFTIHVDVYTKYIINISDRLVVSYTDGRGQFDINSLSLDSAADNPSFLTVLNLPSHIRQNNVSNVFVSNQSGKIGVCLNYDDVLIEINGSYAAVKIPLHYANSGSKDGSKFLESGAYFVSFDFHVDAVTRVTVSEEEKFVLNFVNGNALLDMAFIQPVSVPTLTVINLPLNTSKIHFADIFVYNSSGKTAVCSDYSQIVTFRENNSVSAVIPLANISGGGYFRDSGVFAVSFSLNIDFLTKIIVLPHSRLTLAFTEGNALLNASLIPLEPLPSCLTVTSLPINTGKNSFSDVLISNQAGNIGGCKNYDEIIFEDGGLTAKIPLVYTVNGSKKNTRFEETGAFFVSLDLNVDAVTRVTVSEEEKFVLNFVNGNALLDMALIPEKPQEAPSYLTLKSLPINTKKHNISNVFVYNNNSTVAKCSNYNNIVITTDGSFVTAKIPLSYNSGSERFADSGFFTVSFSVYVDLYSQIIKNRDDGHVVRFVSGSGSVDLADDFGYFSGGLANYDDLLPPVIRKNTTFEMNGSYHVVSSDSAVAAASFSRSSLVYVYASLKVGGIAFEYSTQAPAYNPAKKGYYLDNNRALFKFVFIKDSANKYFAKININDNFTNLSYCTVDSAGLASQGVPNRYSVDGKFNQPPEKITLHSGVYIATLKGANGGRTGGFVSEVFILSNNTTFTLFTGGASKGAGGGCGSFIFSPDGYLLTAGGGGGTFSNISSSGVLLFHPGAGGSIGRGGNADINFPENYHLGGGYDFPMNSIFPVSPSYLDGSAYFNLPPPNDWMNTNNANGPAEKFNSPADDGGNNRNSLRGNNEPSIVDGYITIYTIF